MAGIASEPWTAFKSERWTGFMSESPAAFIGIRMVGALLGHTQAKTTSRYAHLLDDALRAATQKIASITVNGSKNG